MPKDVSISSPIDLQFPDSVQIVTTAYSECVLAGFTFISAEIAGDPVDFS